MNINMIWLIVIIIVIIIIINNKESTKMSNKTTYKILYPHDLSGTDLLTVLRDYNPRDVSKYMNNNHVAGIYDTGTEYQASVSGDDLGMIIEHASDVSDAYTGNDIDTQSSDGYTSSATTSTTTSSSGVLVTDADATTYDDDDDSSLVYDTDIDIDLGPYSVMYGSTEPKYYTRSCKHDLMIAGPFKDSGEAFCQDECTETNGCNYATLSSDGVCRLFSKCKGNRKEKGGKTWVKN